MIKHFGVLLVFFFSIMSGIYFASIERQKQANCKKLFNSMLKTKMLLNYCKTDKKKVMSKIDFEYFIECDKNGKIDSDLFNTAKKYFDDMGSRDFKTESESLDYTVKVIESKLNPLSDRYNQNVKLSLSFGFLCALFFVIVVI